MTLHLTPPENFTPRVHAAMCYVLHGDRYLFLQNSHHDSLPFLWGVPGGGMEAGETSLQAIRRELWEETAIELPEDAFMFWTTFYFRMEGYGDFVAHIYRVGLEGDRPAVVLDPYEHCGMAWMTLQEAQQLPLFVSQRMAIKYLF